jgi:hypothetical protein
MTDHESNTGKVLTLAGSSTPSHRPRRGDARWWQARAGLAALTLAAAAAAVAHPVRAQAGVVEDEQAGWDSQRALGLVERARERRREPVVDESLLSYRAEVSGHIYFFVDLPAQPEPILLRADQVALDLYWAHPDRVKQVIRGMRHEEQFPLRDFNYYLDRYTVIHDGFGDEIRVGEGRDVRNVPHPLGPGAERVYQYRVVDSTTLRLPGAEAPIRVYEIQVRPRSFEAPAIVGSLFLEHARADLVRLSFTFTRAAYLDRRNERIEVMLENALWDGRYWLPREQRLLVRRELPEFDFGGGTVIRAALRVTNYDLNVGLPMGFFAGPPVVLANTREGLRQYAFDVGLYEGFEAVGLAPGQEAATLGDVNIDAIAGRILREQYLSGISRVRLYVPGASPILRYGRTEGLVTGGGLSLALGRSQAHAYAGYAWGSGDPLAEIAWRPLGPAPGTRPFGEIYLNRPNDLGLRPAAAGIVSSGAAMFGSDYRDIHPVSGVAVGVRVGDARSGILRVAATGESHRVAEQAHVTAPFGGEDGFRPVVPAEEGTRGFVRARYERSFQVRPLTVSVEPSVEAGYADFRESGVFSRVRATGTAGWSALELNAGLDVRATVALALGVTPPQHLWYLGGRNTLPGHPFHQYVGDRAAVVDVTAWREVVPGLVRLRLFGAAGWAGIRGAPPVPAWAPGLREWEPGPTDGIRSSVGAGIGLLHGIVRLDYAVRTDTGEGSVILSVDPRLWGFL